jgi:hypothetical protein
VLLEDAGLLAELGDWGVPVAPLPQRKLQVVLCESGTICGDDENKRGQQTERQPGSPHRFLRHVKFA